ncbi:replicative DNA helicase [Dysosmobacter sp. HCP28S3_G4]|uniref:replicative DNA helicase n=1 Tax=Dysosmobacter sp. HCP28S3_G4 TaxID=3438938 RepID=UPI003F0E78E9|nr:replicative DNA helicase [Dysosmobacter sp.]
MANEDLLLRQMPHSLEGEQAVLGSMLIDPDCIKDVMDKLQPGDFYLRQNREIFETIYSMFTYARPVDGITVAEEMQKNGTYDENTTRSYLVQLMEITPTSANVMEYVKIVRDKSLLRAVAQAASEITAMVQEGTGTAGDTLEAAEQRIFAIRRGQSAKDMIPLRQVLPEVLDRLSEMSESEDHLPGLSTGLSAVDAKITGLNKSDLLLLAARPGMGKTSFALNIALNVAKSSQKTVAIFSLEMSSEQLVTRLLSSEAFVENVRLKTGNLRETDWQKIADAAMVLNRLDIRIDDNPMLSAADMNAKCRRLDNLGLVVIDYLQLMTSAGSGKGYGGESRQQVVSDISRMLKIMAKELDVPVLCLSQLSRANEKRDDKRPMLSDLRESGAIEQDADIVLFLYRDDYYNEDSEKHNIAECIVAKNRHGETGKVELKWQPEYTTFATLEKRYDDEE